MQNIRTVIRASSQNTSCNCEAVESLPRVTIPLGDGYMESFTVLNDSS